MPLQTFTFALYAICILITSIQPSERNVNALLWLCEEKVGRDREVLGVNR